MNIDTNRLREIAERTTPGIVETVDWR